MTIARRAIFAATVKVVPPPDSVLQTTAILAKLRTFGHVVEFRQIQPHRQAKEVLNPTSASYKVHFNDAQDLERAVEQRDIEVDVESNHPDPNKVDFYDVFGYQQRHYPPAKSFKCTISPVSNPGVYRIPSQQSPKLVRHEATEALSEGLYWGGVPMNLRQGLSFHPLINQSQQGLDGPTASESSLQVQQAREPLRIVELYRKALKDQEDHRQSTSKAPVPKPKDKSRDASSD